MAGHAPPRRGLAPSGVGLVTDLAGFTGFSAMLILLAIGGAAHPGSGRTLGTVNSRT
jgi:hypothetical protein